MSPQQRHQLNDKMARLAAGEREVFDEVFEVLWPALRSLATRLMGTDVDADDVAQEALLKVFSRIGQYDRAQDGLTWAFTLTAFEVRSMQKRRLRRREEKLASGDFYRSNAPLADVVLIEAELKAQLGSAVDVLSEVDREAISEYLGDETGGASVEPLTAKHRKRRQRALARLKLLWRSFHGLYF